MNPEDRLARVLHDSLDHRQPSPDLADRISEQVSRTGRRRLPRGLKLVPAGAAVLVFVVAAATLSLALSRSSSGPSAPPTLPANETATAIASETAAPTTGGTLSHYSHDGLTFDYPAEWHTSGSVLNEHYVTIFGFVGTGEGFDTCVTSTPGPSDSWLSQVSCGTDIKVDPGQVLVEIYQQDGPPGLGPLDPGDPSRLAPGDRYVTVAGVPAVYSESREGDKLTMTWEISMPGRIYGVYLITATVRDPGMDAIRAQVEALIASVGFDPPIPLLNPADGPRIAAIAVAKEKADRQVLDCFPSELGVSAKAVVTQLPNYGQPLTKPLPATCSTAIEPTAIGLWKLTLTLSWTADVDRTAGSATTTFWLDPDGTPGTMIGFGEVPYQQ